MTGADFYKWAGYLANPVRRTDIHVELNPKKEDSFRGEYRALTGELLTLRGTEKPFYIWKESANKWGVQRRVYFSGARETMPRDIPGINVVHGRNKTDERWRINSKTFIPALFRAGFVIGKNDGRADEIRQRTPAGYRPAFEDGFNIMSGAERAETFIRDQCEAACMRTLSVSEIRSAWKHSNGDLDAALNVLRGKKIIATNDKEGALTFAPPAVFLKNEIERAEIQRAAANEPHPEKREYLIETYARNRGWKVLAKKVFGEYCMYGECPNSFVKEDGDPYIEVHHIVPLHEGGEDGVWNLSVLCAHHHRMAHFARISERKAMRTFLLKKNGTIRNTLR